MQHREETLIGFEGRELFFQSWRPDEVPAQALDAARGRRVLLFAAWAFSALWPSLSVKTRLDLSTLIRDPEVLEEYLHDPLILSTVTARFGAEMMKTIAWVRAHRSDWKLPVLMLYGSEEIFASMDEVREFFGGLACEDKELIIYEGAYHALHCDLQREQVFADIVPHT